MINKIICGLFIILLFCGCNNATTIISSSFTQATAACAVAGAQLLSKDSIEKKYKRKDCPVCKGKGWYISGDDISKVTCGYCEPDTEEQPHKRAPIILRK